MSGISPKRIFAFLLTAVIVVTFLSGCVFPRTNEDWLAQLESGVLPFPSDVSSSDSDKVDYRNLLKGEKISRYEDVFDITKAVPDALSISNTYFISDNEIAFVAFTEQTSTVCVYNIFDGSLKKYLTSEGNSYLYLYPDMSATISRFQDETMSSVEFYKDARVSEVTYTDNNPDYQSNTFSYNGRFTYIKYDTAYSVNNDTKQPEKLFDIKLENNRANLTAEDGGLFVSVSDFGEDEEQQKAVIYTYINGELQPFKYKYDDKMLALQNGRLLLLYTTSSSDMLLVNDAMSNFSGYFTPLKSKLETPVWSDSDDFLTTQSTPENIIRVYDTKKQKCVSEFRFGSVKEMYISSPALSTDKRLLATPFYCYDEEKETNTFFFYIIILDNKPSPEGEYKYGEVPSGERTEQQKRADEMGKRFDLEINLYEEAQDDYDPYKPETLLDDRVIGKALDHLENVLEKFPEGFFKELCSGRFNEMEINLTGKINSGKNVPAAAAFYYSDESYNHIIVADCSTTDYLEYTFAHELMHAIDNYIDIKYYSVKNDGYSDWYSYLPSGFKYNENYLDKKGNAYSDNKFVYQYGSSLKNVYFIDVYQKTFDCEDRAVMFEYLFVLGNGFFESSSKYGLHPAFKSEFLKDRAVYMCEIIRKSFKSVATIDQTQWEKALGLSKDSSAYAKSAVYNGIKRAA